VIYDEDFELLELSEDQVEQLIYDLVGTTLNLDQYLESTFDVPSVDYLSEDTLEDIDRTIFLCESCGWWCYDEDRSENGYEDICDECAEDEE